LERIDYAAQRTEGREGVSRLFARKYTLWNQWKHSCFFALYNFRFLFEPEVIPRALLILDIAYSVKAKEDQNVSDRCATLKQNESENASKNRKYFEDISNDYLYYKPYFMVNRANIPGPSRKREFPLGNNAVMFSLPQEDTSMQDKNMKPEQLMNELAAMRQRVAELERSENEHKKTKDILQESEQQGRSLGEITSDWLWEVDRQGFYTYASLKVKDLLGYEPKEVIGRRTFDFIPPDEAERIAPRFNAIVQSGKPFFRLENINLHRDGRRITLETSGVPVFDELGNLSGYRGIDRDITEKERIRSTFDQTFQLMGFLTPDGMVTAANKTSLDLVKMTESDIIGKLFWETPW
jgi:PAS domain S-box-containing protein